MAKYKRKYQTGGLTSPPTWWQSLFGGGMSPVETGPGKTIMPGKSRSSGTKGSYTPPNKGGYKPSPKGTFNTSSKNPVQPKLSNRSTRLKSGRVVGGARSPKLPGSKLGPGIMSMLLPRGFEDPEGFKRKMTEVENRLWGDPSDEGVGEEVIFNPPLGSEQLPAVPQYAANFPALTNDPASMNPQPGAWRRQQDPLGVTRFNQQGGAPNTPTSSPQKPQGDIVEDPIDTSAPEALSQRPLYETDIDMNRNLETPGLTEADVLAKDSSVAGETAGNLAEEAGGGIPWGKIAQYGPDILNFATGVFGKDKTRPATQVSNRAVNMIDDRVNVNPQLQQARSNYKAIINNPNASPNQKLAAQAQMSNRMNQIYANKFNRERQLEANKASIQARLDSRQSGYDEQYRQDKMASEANLGFTGNFARQSLGNISTKLLQEKAMKAKETGDKRDMMALISSLPEAAQIRILEQYDLD